MEFIFLSQGKFDLVWSSDPYSIFLFHFRDQCKYLGQSPSKLLLKDLGSRNLYNNSNPLFQRQYLICSSFILFTVNSSVCYTF